MCAMETMCAVVAQVWVFGGHRRLLLALIPPYLRGTLLFSCCVPAQLAVELWRCFYTFLPPHFGSNGITNVLPQLAL